jgi:hypothetical protein
MAEATTIPVLPSISLPETLAFYRSLGFEVTHEQTKPYVYAATRRGDINLHFMGIKGLNPDEAFSTCLVLVPEVERLHQTFADALRQAYGKVPLTGRPRISRMKPGQSRFTVVDVAGNSLIFIKQGASEDDNEGASEPHSSSSLGKALRTAARLRDFKNDDAAAAKVLDLALSRGAASADPVERVRALAARLEIAVVIGEQERAEALRAEIKGAALTEEQRARCRSELEAADAALRLTR